ncbi:MAG TPA: fumarylacetoacetate hydrolase [Gammaproteobacteria bacterium]|nr:fumarylacetoacetate hydrolase [Gammaproteobacteria bacterium]
MRIASFSHAGRHRLGVVVGEEVIDGAHDPCLPERLEVLLAAGASGRAALDRLLASDAPRFPLSEVHLGPPIACPGKFLGIGLNYADHVEETGLERPENPTFFNKQVTCVNGPYDPIHLPRVSEKLDYEGELGFVIGRRCRHVPVERAHEVIAGYLIVNDVSVRDWQQKAPTMTLGKSFDTHGPIGPWLVTTDEIPDPQALDFRTTVDGEQRQASNTRHMIFTCREMVAFLSTAFTLEPGDIIATGTCGGVGVRMKPRGYLKLGQRVRVEFQGIGWIENEVIAEPEPAAWG